jgi:hypothetical protein
MKEVTRRIKKKKKKKAWSHVVGMRAGPSLKVMLKPRK